jgi:hypothetical protein
MNKVCFMTSFTANCLTHCIPDNFFREKKNNPILKNLIFLGGGLLGGGGGVGRGGVGSLGTD